MNTINTINAFITVKYKKGSMVSYSPLNGPAWLKRFNRDLEQGSCYIAAKDKKTNTIYIDYK